MLSHIDDLSLKSLKVDVTYVVVDEAHCILDWGEDFRPEFRHIVDLRPHISNIRMLAVTANKKKIRGVTSTRLKFRQQIPAVLQLCVDSRSFYSPGASPCGVCRDFVS